MYQVSEKYKVVKAHHCTGFCKEYYFVFDITERDVNIINILYLTTKIGGGYSSGDYFYKTSVTEFYTSEKLFIL